MTSEYIVGNRGGIVYTTATQVSAGSSSSNAIYSLPNHIFRFLGPCGVMVVTIPTGVTSVLGTTIQVNSQSMTLTDNENSAVTVLPAGEHMFSFNKVSNTIKMLL